MVIPMIFSKGAENSIMKRFEQFLTDQSVRCRKALKCAIQSAKHGFPNNCFGDHFIVIKFCVSVAVF